MKSRSCDRLVVVGALLCLALATSTQAALLGDANSSVFIDEGSIGPGYMLTWEVDGVHHLANLNYFYRVGPAVLGNAEAPVSTLGLTGSAAIDTNPWDDARPDLLAAQYGGGGAFTVDLKISLVGGPVGSGLSDSAHQLKITNLGEGPLDFHLFQYVDFDLGGIAGGDTVGISLDPITSLPDQILQTTAGYVVIVNEHVTPDAFVGDTDIFPGLIALLTDPDGSDLSGDLGPTGPGDVEYALQWDVVIPEGGSFILSKDILITPEPTTLMLGLAGLVGLGLVRRRRG